jgi:ADP-heptose:LPS heptosyltransferase
MHTGLKILVIRFSSIGDILFTTPVFRCLKQQLENVEVHFLCKKSFKDVTRHNPYIDKFHYFEDDLSATIRALKVEQFDYVIDLHKNFRTTRIKWALKTQSFTFEKETWRKWLLTKTGINKMTGKHITQRSLDAVAPLGVKDDGRGLDYFLSEQDEVSYSDLPTSHLAGFVAIVIGASYATKKLPVEQLQQLCEEIPYPIILIGGPEDIKEGETVASIDSIKIYNACGKFSLNQSADLVRKSKVVVSHDTGLQYAACAFNKPVVAIWGATSPKLDVAPYYGSESNQGDKFENFIVPNLNCQPCSNYGTRKCPKGHFKCMRNQDIKRIGATVVKFWRA